MTVTSTEKVFRNGFLSLSSVLHRTQYLPVTLKGLMIFFFSFVSNTCMFLGRKRKRESQGNLILIFRSNYINIHFILPKVHTSHHAKKKKKITLDEFYLGHKIPKIILYLNISSKQTEKGHLFFGAFYILI